MEKSIQEEVRYTAVYKYAPVSAQKVRPFADLIRGKNADEAMALLQFYPNRGAAVVGKTLKSALHNAEDLREPDLQNLSIVEVRVDGGPMFKRWRPKSRGMSTIVKKRSSHITVVLGQF